MDFTLSPQDHAFREEVRAFFRDHLPDDLARKQRQGFYPTGPDIRRWQQILYRRGWAAPGWPKEFGGPGFSPMQRYIFEDETGLNDAPDPAVVNINLVGPVVWRFGSSEQKARYLEPLLKGEILTCQGFSEPNAGSDLASLRTRAVRDGDDWIVSGQKVWTSEAQFADLMICLARTEPEGKPQAGLSMLMVDLSAPGVQVRPIPTINGETVVNEVFLDEVRVPGTDLLGEVNRGWTYTKFLLAHERTYNAHVNRLKRDVQRIRELATEPNEDRSALIRDPVFRARLARLEIDVIALDWAVMSALFDDEGDGLAMAAASGLKIEGSHLQLRASELLIQVLGRAAIPFYRDPSVAPYADDMPMQAPDHAPGVTSHFLYRRAATIFGGANDIQRGLIWNTALRE